MMKQPVVKPLSNADDLEFQKLILFFEETLGFCPNSLKTMYHQPRITDALQFK